MKTLFRLVLLSLVLLLVAMASALLAMRFAIHGTEVTVPKAVGLSPSEAERAVAGQGLSLNIERQYYSSDVAEGKLISQVPAAGTKERRGWQVRAAQSLGPQRVAIPDVLGQSGRAADLNIRRRGLDIGSIAYLPMPGITADQVLAQSPPPNASDVSVPRIGLLVTAGPPTQTFVMPSFVGQPLGSVNLVLLDAGFHHTCNTGCCFALSILLIDYWGGHFLGRLSAGHGLGYDQSSRLNSYLRQMRSEPQRTADARQRSDGYSRGRPDAVRQGTAEQRSKRCHAHEHHGVKGHHPSAQLVGHHGLNESVG